MTQVAVVGVGYVGLTTAVGLSSLGHHVVGIDTNPERVSALLRRQCPIFEAGLPDLLAQGVESGRLTFTSDVAQGASTASVVFLCVPTPEDEDGSADLSYVLAAARAASAHMGAGSVLVTKSTVPVGTGAMIAAAIGREDIAVVSNPEFLREGTALADFMEPDRIVIGADTTAAAHVVADLYSALEAPVVQTTVTSAELIKYASNAFLSVKLSFVNDLAALCEATGGDISEVTHGIGLDSRIGPHFLKPGPGWGGSCFPKDAKALNALAEQVDIDLPLVTAAIASNDRANRRVVDMVAALLPDGLAGARVACWGVAFKAHTDDTRESPAVTVMHRLHEAGATVVAHDPVAHLPAGVPALQAATPEEALVGADVLVVLTEWPEYRAAPAAELVGLMRQPAVVDTRNVLDHAEWRSAGAAVTVLGRPH